MKFNIWKWVVIVRVSFKLIKVGKHLINARKINKKIISADLINKYADL